MESEKHNSETREKIAQKVDRLKEFCKNNPILWISGYDFLNSIEDKAERKNLEGQLGQALLDYKYIYHRESEGKLSNEHIELLREAGVGRVFGYKKEIEDVANQYSYDDVESFKKFLYYACAEYGNLDCFEQHYIESLINGGADKYNVGEFLNKHVKNPDILNKYFITDFDISSPNFQNEEDKGYALIWEKLKEGLNISGVTFDKTKIKETIDNSLSDVERQVLKLRFGLKDGTMHTLKEIGEIKEVSKERISQIEKRAFFKLIRKFRFSNNLMIEEQTEKAFIKKYFEYHGIFADEKQTELDSKVLRTLQSILDAKDNIQTNKNDNIDIGELNLSVRCFNCLKRSGINNVNDIVDLELRDFLKIKSIGKLQCDEIMDAVHSLGLKMKWEIDSELSDSQKDESAKIEDLNLSTSAYTCLRRVKIETVNDITKLTAQDFRKMEKLKKQDFEDIINVVHSSGLEMKWEKDSKLSDSKKRKLK